MTALAAPVPTDVDPQSIRRAGLLQGTVPRSHLVAPISWQTRTGG